MRHHEAQTEPAGGASVLTAELRGRPLADGPA